MIEKSDYRRVKNHDSRRVKNHDSRRVENHDRVFIISWMNHDKCRYIHVCVPLAKNNNDE